MLLEVGEEKKVKKFPLLGSKAKLALLRELSLARSSSLDRQKKKKRKTMSGPAQPQQLDRRLSSRRRSRALSLGRWGGGGGNVGGGGGGDGTAAGNAQNGDDGDGNVVAGAEPRTALPLLNEYAAAKASGVGSKISEVSWCCSVCCFVVEREREEREERSREVEKTAFVGIDALIFFALDLDLLNSSFPA